MKCCKQKDNLNKANSNPSWMICIVAILISIVIPFMGVFNLRFANVGMISFLCTIIMIFMMQKMISKNRSEVCRVRQTKELMDNKMANYKWSFKRN